LRTRKKCHICRYARDRRAATGQSLGLEPALNIGGRVAEIMNRLLSAVNAHASE
jgi:hypothetical protein